jgi:AGZA family xanthine/uracil permease-like MFS transporter
MPLSFSISEGIGIGFITYLVFMIGTNRLKQVTPVAYCLAALFLAHYLTE